jgi:cytochrome c heme-lyase
MGNTQTIVDGHGSGNQGQEATQSSGCPVMHNDRPKPEPSTNTTEQSTSSSGCPVMHGNSDVPKYRHKHVYNVYGEIIDPKNQMPANPNQLPHPSQQTPLSTERQHSTIRKAGGEETDTWLYPSQQMFYNALMRKGKGNGVRSEDMATVIAIHNGVNERTWLTVVEWEKTLHTECNDPRLLKFMGRPDTLSPKAMFKHYLLGYPRPFDRHDWIVDRCGKKEQRYVIDYYYDDNMTDGDRLDVDEKRGFAVPRRVVIDARPALDDFESFYDRFRYMMFKNVPWLNKKNYETNK